ncbi:MAG: LysR family transcriptional regulator [Sphingomonadales bacterium]|nr:LysR family transcriptional regulator [Sphingomonadales bacterium]MDE2171067.1 LysR family transcriptional regulator [Sphingomonadales bacterium]
MDPDYDLFLAIVAAGSIAAAARGGAASAAGRLSPASLSKRLARLEERLGVRLIHRTTRRMVLTPAGESLHRDLLAITQALAQAEARITGAQDKPQGPLRITAPTSFGRMHLAPALARFLARYPDIALQLDLSDEFVDLIEGRYDVALRITARVEGALVAHRLVANRRVLCASPDYLARRGTPATLADLARHDVLAAQGQMPWPLDGPSGEATYHADSAVRTNSSEVVREMVLGGRGIALRSLWDVAPALASGALLRVLPEWEGSKGAALSLVYPPAPRVPAVVQALIDHMQGEFAHGAPWDRPDLV